LYVPKLPKKKKIGNKDHLFVEERCFYLNMFFKQLVRCPYIYESEELNLFIRPPNDPTKALTLLPRISYEKQLNRIQQYYHL
jgi:hypothetical protein